MYFSHLLESDFALTTGKHTQMTKENSKGMSASNAGKITFQGSPYNAYTFELHTQVTLSKSRSEIITMIMICSLIEHGFLPVFSTERKVMLYSNLLLLIMNAFNQNIKSTVMEMALHEIFMSIPSLTPGRPPASRGSHILVAPGVRFRSFLLPGGLPDGS